MQNESRNSNNTANPVKAGHILEIGMKRASPDQILAAKKITLRNRILNTIFGKGYKMVVIVPGECVGTISITEMENREICGKESKDST